MSAAPRTRPAHAKLNLALRVLAREHSGYHQIETIFCALELADEVEVTLTNAGITLEVAAPADEAGPPADLGPTGQNLAYRAASLFARSVPLDRGIDIRLTKRIPAGAGLGGGSSDAAAVLAVLNDLHGRPLSAAELLGLGARLGSDVPFFLTGATLALAWGRGGRIAPLPPLPPATVLLAVPPERVSTADAYAALAAAQPEAPALFAAPRSWLDVGAIAHNDFERPIFERHPRLADIRQQLQDAGAIVARMTGTGSVVFGVFDDARRADTAARDITAAHPDVPTIITRTAQVLSAGDEDGGRAVPGGGFEPPLADPKSAVLPLDDPGMHTN